MREYDAESNLIQRGAPLGIALMALCLLTGVALYLLIPKKAETRRKSAMPTLYLFLDLPAAAVLAGAGVLTVMRYFESGTLDSGRLTVLAIGLLMIFSAASLSVVAVRASKGAVPSGYGLYLAIPVFWACSNLIGDFFEHSGNPVLSDYAYILLSYVAITLALFSACSRFYLGRVSNRTMPFYASLGVMLSMVALAGPTLAKWMLNPEPLPRAADLPLSKQLILLFIFLHCLALLWLAARNAFDENFVPKYKEADEPHDEIPADIDIMIDGLDPNKSQTEPEDDS